MLCEPISPWSQREMVLNWSIYECRVNAGSRFAPENMSLPPIPSPANANKRMAESVRATRNVPFLRLSPLAQYRSAKGSSAWEATVRSRPDIVKEDPSWKINEKAEESLTEAKRKSTGGLLSLFSRRSAAPATNEEQPSSPSPRSSWTHSRTSSVDPSPAIPSASVVPASSAVANVTKVELPPIAEPSTNTTSNFDDIVIDAAPPPSAVSRFFGRFSRSTSGGGSHSRRNSLALSTDDMDFLSDTGAVPSYSDDDNNFEDDSLNLFTAVTPQKPASVPPLLAPPPKAPATPTQRQFPTESVVQSLSAFNDQPTFSQPASVALRQSAEPDFSFLSSTSFRPSSTSSTMAQPSISRQSSGTARKTPIAVMSSSSTSPPPTMQSSAFSLPPPPSNSRPVSPSTPSRASSFTQSFALSPPPKPPQTRTNALIGEFSSYARNSHYTSDSMSSMSSNQSLFSQSTSDGKAHDPFDDFDDFVDGSSSFNTPSPPRPPPKPTTIRPPIQQPQQRPYVTPTLFSQSTAIPGTLPSPASFSPPPAMQNPLLSQPLNPTTSSHAPTSNGKLSAQDLSFFEGL